MSNKELEIIEYLIKDVKEHIESLEKFAIAEEKAKKEGRYLSEWWTEAIPKKAPIKENLKLIRRLSKKIEEGLK